MDKGLGFKALLKKLRCAVRAWLASVAVWVGVCGRLKLRRQLHIDRFTAIKLIAGRA